MFFERAKIVFYFSFQILFSLRVYF